MNDTKIIWYSITLELATKEHGPVGLDEAVEIVERYRSLGNVKYESAEEGLTASMFGFSRSKSEFIEFCINGSRSISYKFEMSDPNASWFNKLFKGVYQHEDELHSHDELVKKVEEFFTTPMEEIRRRLEKRD